MPINGIDESGLASQHVDHADSAVANRSCSFGDFVLDVARGDDRLLVAIDKLTSIKPLLDAPLALFDNLW